MSEKTLPTTYQHTEHESQIYAQWEQSNAFAPIEGDKDPFSILMPPPNANASLHAGHAMYVIQDILIRWKRMQGHPTVWFPGTDHAGYETQFVYEKELKKQGKSRFQFDRNTLHKNIAEFVRNNSGLIVEQMKALGFSADWKRQTFTLDEKVLKLVFNTFQRLQQDGLIYRDNYLVNYCPKCGTTFADLEITHEERPAPLYYVRYRFADGEPRMVGEQEVRHLVVATVRPETIFADAAVALHPNDPRAKFLKGEYVINPLTHQVIPVIFDEYVDPEFGSGVLKVTPAHDPNDFILGKKHSLPVNITINTLGKIDLSWWTPDNEPLLSRVKQLREQFHDVSVSQAREKVAKLLETEGSIDTVNYNYINNLTICYKGKHPIEPLPYPNWFLKMENMAKLGLEAINTGETSIIPNRFIKQYTQWLENIRDWPISRQIVWGIRLPVWYQSSKNPDIFVSFLDKNQERHNVKLNVALEKGFTLAEIKAGLQSLIAPTTSEYVVSQESPGDDYLQETDTFDTWFSSGQWPLAVLEYPNGSDYKRFYPTSVLDSMWDILFFWIARMIMLGKYLTQNNEHPTGISPFKTVYLHSMVTDAKGAKMSKSKGNVVNPLEIIKKYGADALRISLVAGSAAGNPIALSEPKVKGYRNFGNKIWNIGRFIQLQELELGDVPTELSTLNLNDQDKAIIAQRDLLISDTTQHLEKFRFSDAALGLYGFIWDELANKYLEENKNREDKQVYLAVVKSVYLDCLKLLHPFMPFVTEALWSQLQPDQGQLITSTWPS